MSDDTLTRSVRIPADLAADLDRVAERIRHPDLPPPSQQAVIVAVLRAGVTSYLGAAAPTDPRA